MSPRKSPVDANRLRPRAQFTLDAKRRADLRQVALDADMPESRIVEMGLDAILPALRKVHPSAPAKEAAA